MCTLAPWTIGADSPPASDFILDIEQGSQSAISLLKKLSSDKTPIAGQKIPQRYVEGGVLLQAVSEYTPRSGSLSC